VRATARQEDGVAQSLHEAPGHDALLNLQPLSQARVDVKRLVVDRVRRRWLLAGLGGDTLQEGAYFAGVIGTPDVPHRASRLALIEKPLELVVILGILFFAHGRCPCGAAIVTILCSTAARLERDVSLALRRGLRSQCLCGCTSKRLDVAKNVDGVSHVHVQASASGVAFRRRRAHETALVIQCTKAEIQFGPQVRRQTILRQRRGEIASPIACGVGREGQGSHQICKLGGEQVCKVGRRRPVFEFQECLRIIWTR